MFQIMLSFDSLSVGLLADEITAALIQLYARFGVPRRTVHYKPTKAVPQAYPRFADPIKAVMRLGIMQHLA